MKSRSQVVRERKIVLLFSAAVIISVIICSIIFGSIRTEAAPAEPTYKYYTSVTIEAGDSLWSIAANYKTVECGDMDDYIREICKLNHIGESDAIHAGQYLTIPYYSTEYKM